MARKILPEIEREFLYMATAYTLTVNDFNEGRILEDELKQYKIKMEAEVLKLFYKYMRERLFTDYGPRKH